jgi:hypothetical protein
VSVDTGIADQINAEVRAAWHTINQAAYVAREIAPLLVGHLYGLNPEVLRDLKRELNQFDLRTLRWRP